jgi:hypothetical protein
MTRAVGNFLLAFSMLTASAWAGQFKKAVYYGAGQLPNAVVTAHLTQSGNLDLAFADWLSDQVVILLGKGDGTFQRARTFSAPNPIELAVGDFNEDGNEDLAIVESNGTGNGSLAIFLGDGKGGFRLSASYPIGVVSGFVTVADFNGDGHLDAAVSDQGVDSTPGDVIVFFGDGHGKLRRVATFKMLHQQPTGIAAGDLNGDHHPDLAVALAGTGSVAVLLNDGTGHFGKPVTYSAGGGEVVDVKIADLRHDGRNDLVVANGSLSAVGVLLNKGNGTFGEVQLYPTHCDVEAVTVADFNLDGHLDAAVVANGDNSALIYGKGDGTFGPPVPIKDAFKNQGGYSIAAGNFVTGNKAPDLAIPIEEYGKVAIMINTQ